MPVCWSIILALEDPRRVCNGMQIMAGKLEDVYGHTTKLYDGVIGLGCLDRHT